MFIPRGRTPEFLYSLLRREEYFETAGYAAGSIFAPFDIVLSGPESSASEVLGPDESN